MSREERYGNRDLAFSGWHRALARDDLTWIDIDYCAYCDTCKEPLFLIELAKDVGQAWKATTITRKVANKLAIPALLVFYTVEKETLTSFRVRRIAPEFSEFKQVEPQVLADWIARQHDEHVCVPPVTEVEEAA